MSDDLLGKIYKEVRKSGYPTELIVNKKFQSKDWCCTENQYYIDLDENKGREIDLSAHKSRQCHALEDISVWSKLSIEIKKCKKPWVIFTSDKKNTDTGGYGFLNHINNISNEILSYHAIMEKHPSSLFNRLGRNAFIPFTKDNPQIFSALLSSVKSCIERHRADLDHKEAYNESSYDIVFYSPLVIVDSRLFEAYLENNDELKINEAEHIVYSFNYASPNYKSKQYLVDIVTLSGLDNYLDQQSVWIDSIFNTLHSRINAKNTQDSLTT